MTITIVMKKTKQLSLRVSALAKDLLALEQRATGESEADIVERCLLQCLQSREDACKLIRQYATEDIPHSPHFSRHSRHRCGSTRARIRAKKTS